MQGSGKKTSLHATDQYTSSSSWQKVCCSPALGTIKTAISYQAMKRQKWFKCFSEIQLETIRNLALLLLLHRKQIL
jgi:hypothetical protein